MTREQEETKIKAVYDLPRNQPVGSWIYQQWKASQPLGGEMRCRVKFEIDETKLYKQLKIEKQKSYRERIERGLAYLNTQNPKLFQPKKLYTKTQRTERKKIIITIVDTLELNFEQTTKSLNEWTGKQSIDVASVRYIYSKTKA